MRSPADIDAQLIGYAQTDRQREVVAAVIEHGSMRAASRAMGCAYNAVHQSMAAVRARAARQGWSPTHDMRHPVPDGFKLKGTSTLYDQDGVQRLQWVKSTRDQERQAELMQAAIAAMCEDIGKADPVAPPRHTHDDLANCYVVTDVHIGHRAWPEECGEAYDTAIAERLLYAWFAEAIRLAPEARVGILAQLGDLATIDAVTPATPASGNILDVDSRIQKVIRVAIRVLRRIMRLLLQKHEHVHVIMADANHDPVGSAWLREMFAAHYENDPRVTVDCSPDTYYCYEHGLTAIYAHHGHKCKPQAIDDVFASKFRETFGRTKYGYAHMGHQHHAHVIETNLMIVEQHQALCARDSYASSHGYMAGRSAQVITYSKQHGEVGRLRITPEMLDTTA